MMAPSIAILLSWVSVVSERIHSPDIASAVSLSISDKSMFSGLSSWTPMFLSRQNFVIEHQNCQLLDHGREKKREKKRRKRNIAHGDEVHSPQAK